MVRKRQPDYIDSKGLRHIIEYEGDTKKTLHTEGGGISFSFIPTGIYIDGKRWAEFDDMGMAGDLKELVEKEIEMRIKS